MVTGLIFIINYFVIVGGGVESNWVDSAYDDEKIGGMLGRENQVLGENLSQCRFVHHKPHMLCP
jgi:hypothetical protein